ncbi:MAG: SH3 domain-containing protein [Eubacteriales bacterium]|nr:SH3 domain-containing protein [Eubacteriales bacterium]
MKERQLTSRGLKMLQAAILFAFVLACVVGFKAVNVKAGTMYTVSVQSGYLALRTAPAYDDSNEIGKLYSGDQVEATGGYSGKYLWVYSSKLGKSGYVNGDYLIGAGSSVSGASYTVRVASGYLALRTAPSYNSSNEIGELYSGDTVQIAGSTSGKYVWVYSPKLNKQGYVNGDYLVGYNGGSSGNNYSSYASYTVSVASGYLALRTAPSYNSSNEIGALYSGETVYVVGGTSGSYVWVYSPKLGREGYVNGDYLVGYRGGSSSKYSKSYTVSVASGYLALRTAPSYSTSNEIGALYSGETVYAAGGYSGEYLWVYSPKLGREGYVNANYLY